MNLSPDWVEVFEQNEIEAVHWFEVGDPREIDRVIDAATKNRGGKSYPDRR